MPGPPDGGVIGVMVPVVVAGSAVTVPAVVVLVVVVGMAVTVLGPELVGSGGGGSYGFRIVPLLGTPVAVPVVVGAGRGVIVPVVGGMVVTAVIGAMGGMEATPAPP